MHSLSQRKTKHRYKKDQPSLRLLNGDLRDHRHLCWLLCLSAPPEILLNPCAGAARDHAVNQGRRTINCCLWFIRHGPCGWKLHIMTMWVNTGFMHFLSNFYWPVIYIAQTDFCLLCWTLQKIHHRLGYYVGTF